MCKRILKDETRSDGDVPFYKIGTFGKQTDAYISREIYENYKSRYSYPKKGDILISASGTIGRLVVFDGAEAYFQDSNIVWIDNNESLVKNEFLFYCYENVKWVTDDNTIARLYNDNLRCMKILITSIPEQQKIANCLSSVDDLITAHTQKHEALKAYKKGLMQQLFPAEGETAPQLRFPEFRDAGEWEEKLLGDVATFSKGKGLPKSAITLNGKNSCIHYGELFTEYSEVIVFIKSRTNLNDGYFSVENDVLMPTSDVTPSGLAKACCIKLNKVILGSDILVIRADKTLISGEFISRQIRYLEQKVLQLVSGSTVFHLYASSIQKLALHIPSLKEQQKIAGCLSSLDDLITAHTQKHEALKAHKKGLMQQLFPAIDEVGGYP